MIDSKNFLLLLLSFIIGTCLTIFFLDYENLGFTNTNWLTLYDSKSDFLALKFFLDDKWRFPIGLNPNYGELKNSRRIAREIVNFREDSKIYLNS